VSLSDTEKSNLWSFCFFSKPDRVIKNSDRSIMKVNQTIGSSVLTDRVIQNSDRHIVKENQTICSPVLTDRVLKNSDRPIVEENQMLSEEAEYFERYFTPRRFH
jgi:hypothetical protein